MVKIDIINIFSRLTKFSSKDSAFEGGKVKRKDLDRYVKEIEEAIDKLFPEKVQEIKVTELPRVDIIEVEEPKTKKPKAEEKKERTREETAKKELRKGEAKDIGLSSRGELKELERVSAPKDREQVQTKEEAKKPPRRIVKFFDIGGAFSREVSEIPRKEKGDITPEEHPAREEKSVEPPSGTRLRIKPLVDLSMKNALKRYMTFDHEEESEDRGKEEKFIEGDISGSTAEAESFADYVFLDETEPLSSEGVSLSVGEEKLDYEAELYYFVGLQQLKKGNLALAENYLGHSLKLNPHRLDCQIALADVHFRRGDSVRAFQEYQRLLELNPQNVKVLRKLGLAFFLGGNSAEAEKMLRLVLKYDPYQDDVYVLLAEIELRQGKLKKAEDLLKKSLTLEVRGKVKAQALLRLTQIAWHQRDFRAVENYLQAGLTADPENYYLLLSLAWLRVSSPLTDQRNVQEAQRLWQKAIRLKGVSHETNLVLAGIYSELGELDKAREVLRHLSGIDEEFPISTREKDKENLGEVLIKEGKIISIKPPFWLKMTY